MKEGYEKCAIFNKKNSETVRFTAKVTISH